LCIRSIGPPRLAHRQLPSDNKLLGTGKRFEGPALLHTSHLIPYLRCFYNSVEKVIFLPPGNIMSQDVLLVEPHPFLPITLYGGSETCRFLPVSVPHATQTIFKSFSTVYQCPLICHGCSLSIKSLDSLQVFFLSVPALLCPHVSQYKSPIALAQAGVKTNPGPEKRTLDA
jgi:hypothetical protein